MSHDDKYGEDFDPRWLEPGGVVPVDAKTVGTLIRVLSEWIAAHRDLTLRVAKAEAAARSAIGASAEKAMDRIVENSREQIDEAARNMGKAASIGLGVGPIPAPVSHGGDTPRTDALISSQDQRSAVYFPLRLDEMTELARQLERELAAVTRKLMDAEREIDDYSARSARGDTNGKA